MFFQYTGDPIPPLKRKTHKEEKEDEIAEFKNSKSLLSKLRQANIFRARRNMIKSACF